MADNLSELSKGIRSIGQNVANQGNSFRQTAAESNRNVINITKDIAGHFVRQRGSLDNVVDSNRQTSASIDSLGRKIDNNSNLITQSVSATNDVASLLKTTNNLLLQIARNTSQLGGGGLLGGVAGAAGGAGALSSAANIASAFGRLGVRNVAALGGMGAMGMAGILKSAADSRSAEGGGGASDGASGVTPGSAPGGGNVTPANITGNATEAMQFFQSKGWSKEQAAGIVGNLQVESGNFSSAVLSGQKTGDGGKAVGVAQWHPDRQAIFRRQMGKPVAGSSFKEQLEFVHWELNNTEKRAGYMLRQATSASQAAAIVDQYYERSSGAHRSQRVSNANNLAGQNGNATPQSSPGGASAAPAGGGATPSATGAQPSVNVPGTLHIGPSVGTPLAPMKDRVRKSENTGRPTPQSSPGGASSVELASTMVGRSRRESLDYLAKGGQVNRGEAWCAEFVNSTLKQTGQTGSGSAVANSFQNWGGAVKPGEVKAGDIVIQTRGKGPGETGGHVGIATGQTQNGQIEMIAGNSGGGKVKKYFVPIDSNLMIRRGSGNGGLPFDPSKIEQGTDLPGSKASKSDSGETRGLGGLGGMGGLPGMGMGFGGLGMGMMGGRMGAFGALAGMALGGLGAALGPAAAAPAMPSGPTPTTPALQTPSQGFVSPFTGIDPNNPAQFFAADKQLQNMMRSREIQTAATNRDVNLEKKPVVNVNQTPTSPDQSKPVINDNMSRDTQTTVLASWEDAVYRWLGVQKSSNFA